MEAIYQFYYAQKKSKAAPYEPKQLLCEWFNDELTKRDIDMLKVGMAFTARLKYKSGAILVYKQGKLINSCTVSNF